MTLTKETWQGLVGKKVVSVSTYPHPEDHRPDFILFDDGTVLDFTWAGGWELANLQIIPPQEKP